MVHRIIDSFTGVVYVCGGYHGGVLDSCVYLGASDRSWQSAPSMDRKRVDFATVPYGDDGVVMLAGGY